MKKPENIYIFTGPVRSGKTTRLKQWLDSGIDAAGILTPDAGQIRMLYDIGRKQYHTFEVGAVYAGEQVAVGRFLFARNAFDKGREILEKPYPETSEWLVIDEVGRLEIMQGEGWEPMVLRAVAAYREEPARGKLLLVIRDSLLEAALRKYDLEQEAIIIKALPV